MVISEQAIPSNFANIKSSKKFLKIGEETLVLSCQAISITWNDYIKVLSSVIN